MLSYAQSIPGEKSIFYLPSPYKREKSQRFQFKSKEGGWVAGVPGEKSIFYLSSTYLVPSTVASSIP